MAASETTRQTNLKTGGATRLAGLGRNLPAAEFSPMAAIAALLPVTC